MYTVYYKKIEVAGRVYKFSHEKNARLLAERDICFESVITLLNSDQLLRIFEHPNQQKYPGQKIAEILVSDYVYMIPFIIENNGDVFLLTIFPSRKAKKRYLTGENIYENDKN